MGVRRGCCPGAATTKWSRRPPSHAKPAGRLGRSAASPSKRLPRSGWRAMSRQGSRRPRSRLSRKKSSGRPCRKARAQSTVRVWGPLSGLRSARPTVSWWPRHPVTSCLTSLLLRWLTMWPLTHFTMQPHVCRSVGPWAPFVYGGPGDDAGKEKEYVEGEGGVGEGGGGGGGGGARYDEGAHGVGCLLSPAALGRLRAGGPGLPGLAAERLRPGSLAEPAGSDAAGSDAAGSAAAGLATGSPATGAAAPLWRRSRLSRPCRAPRKGGPAPPGARPQRADDALAAGWCATEAAG